MFQIIAFDKKIWEMSLNPTHGSDVKDQQGSSYAVAVTGEAPGGDEEGACQDEVKVKDASAEGYDSLLPSQQKRAVRNETVGAEFHPDSKSISARDLQQKLVDIGPEDLSVLLPKEIVLMLFELMTPKDIVAASQTCRLWRILGENDKLWHQKCKEAGLAYSLNSADLMMIQRRNEASTILHSPWKVNFLKPFKIEKKLRHEVPQILTIESSHNVKQMEVFNNRIVVCSNYTPTLSVFSALSGDLLHELVEHTGDVNSIRMDDQFIVSGSHDRSVKVWDVDTGSCLHTMLGHLGPVLCLKMQGNIAVSGSCDGTLRVWDVREGRCLRTFSRHIRGVYLVQFDGNVVISGSFGGTIKIWDLETGECRRTMRHSSRIISLKFNDVDVVAGCDDGSIKVWDGTNGVCSHTLVGNDKRFRAVMELQGDTLVCSGEDETTAKIWSLVTGASLHTLTGAQKHSRWITGIQIIRKLVVTSSEDGTVKLWDLTTGEFIRDLLVESGGRVEKMKIEDANIVCAVRSNEGSKLLVLNFENNEN